MTTLESTDLKVPWVAVTLHFPWNSKRRQRQVMLSKWIYESRKHLKLRLAYIGAVFQKHRSNLHHAHLTLFGINKQVGFGILDINTAELQALWFKITGLKGFKAIQIEVKKDFNRWNNHYIFQKNVKEAKDYESIYFNTQLLKAAGIKISKKGFTK